MPQPLLIYLWCGFASHTHNFCSRIYFIHRAALSGAWCGIWLRCAQWSQETQWDGPGSWAHGVPSPWGSTLRHKLRISNVWGYTNAKRWSISNFWVLVLFWRQCKTIWRSGSRIGSWKWFAGPGISTISVEESLVDSNVTCRSKIVIIDLGCD